MKKVFFALLILSASMPVLAETNVALVFATGGLGDKAFNDTALEGIQRAEKEYNINFDYAEPVAITEYETYLAQFANAGRYDLIICIGFDQADALTTVTRLDPIYVDVSESAARIMKVRQRIRQGTLKPGF